MTAPLFVARVLRAMRIDPRHGEMAKPLVKNGSMTIKRQRVLLEQEAAKRRTRRRSKFKAVFGLFGDLLAAIGTVTIVVCFVAGALLVFMAAAGDEQARAVFLRESYEPRPYTYQDPPPSTYTEERVDPGSPVEDTPEWKDAEQALSDLAKEQNPQTEQAWRWLAVEFAVANEYRYCIEVALEAYVDHGGTQDEFRVDYFRWSEKGSNPYLERI